MYNENTKKATMKYLKKLKTVTFRVHPDEYEEMRAACERSGHESMRQFLLAAIREKISALDH